MGFLAKWFLKPQVSFSRRIHHSLFYLLSSIIRLKKHTALSRNCSIAPSGIFVPISLRRIYAVMDSAKITN